MPFIDFRAAGGLATMEQVLAKHNVYLKVLGDALCRFHPLPIDK
jgi:hypothetical protein